MDKNMNGVDRIVRAIIAITFAVLYFMGIIPGVIGIVLVAVGVIFLLTSFISFCPIYWAVGIRTRPKEQ